MHMQIAPQPLLHAPFPNNATITQFNSLSTSTMMDDSAPTRCAMMLDDSTSCPMNALLAAFDRFLITTQEPTLSGGKMVPQIVPLVCERELGV